MKNMPPLRIEPALKRPLHVALWHFSAACFIGTLLTDLTYWRTAEMMWTNFSAWLLAAGLVLGVMAAILLAVDFATNRLRGPFGTSWAYLLGNAVVMILSFINALVHSRDAWTSVVPTGLALSISAVVVLIASAILDRQLAYRRAGGAIA
jgi:uncharacterized membrane protein